MPAYHLTCKRQRCCSQHSSPHHRHALRLLAPKGQALPCHPERPVLHKQQLGHNNTQVRQHTEEANGVNLQQSATSHSGIPLKPVSSGHNFTPSYLLQPGRTFSSLERKKYSAAAPCANIYSNGMPLTPAGDGFPENLLVGVVTRENPGLSTYLPYGHLQPQGTIQNQHSGDYCIPIPDAPEDLVWAAMEQPTIDVHQDQSPQYTIDQPPPISIQPLPAVQPTHHAPLPQYSQHMPCAKCPSIWCFHLESITLSGPEGKGINNLRRSYENLRQHIHEAHQLHYGASCTLCENLFCYHLGKMIHLEVAKVDFADVKVNLGSSFMTLRQHIQEAHGGC